MQEKVKNTFKGNIALFGNVRVLVAAALLAAMSLILGKFLQIPNPFQNIIRISFENLPIIFAAISFGPAIGAVVGVAADLVGCLLYGYSINPLITLGAATVGIVAGVVSNYIVRRPTWLSTALSVLCAHICGSVVVKSFGLAAWYLSSYNMGLVELMLWRLLTYTVIGVAEFVILFLLFRSRAVTNQIEKFKTKRKKQ